MFVREKVIKAILDSGENFMSGEQLSKKLGISRTAVWKHINALREEGYNIEEKFADRNEGMIPHEKMPEYYNSIDVYMCIENRRNTSSCIRSNGMWNTYYINRCWHCA